MVTGKGDLEPQGTPAHAADQLRVLWQGVRPDPLPHEVDPGALGEYAVLLWRSGRPQAARVYPAVAAHLNSGCEICRDDLRRLLAFLSTEFAEDASGSAP